MILAIDLSTKPGVAILEGEKLIHASTCFNDKTVEDFGIYPQNYIEFTLYTINKLLNYIQALGYKWNQFEKIILEETTSSKNNYSQKKLEFLHYQFLLTFSNLNDKIVYIRSEVWKRSTHVKMSKEESANNSKIRRLKQKTGKRVIRKDEKGNKLRKVSRHDVYIRQCNTIFGTSYGRKEEDSAAASLLGLAYQRNAPICDGKTTGGTLKGEK